jgi:phosphoheptose isomerase
VNSRPFVGQYLERMGAALGALDTLEVEACCQLLWGCIRRDATIFIAGNGGSASLADHLACDLVKGLLGREHPQDARVHPRAHSLSANAALCTAWANDVGYDAVFSGQLRSLARRGDLLIVISASGNSPNILQALRAAQELGVDTLGWLGFDGGQARELCRRSVLVECHDYGVVESVHATMGHLVTDWLRKHIVDQLSPTLSQVTQLSVSA